MKVSHIVIAGKSRNSNIRIYCGLCEMKVFVGFNELMVFHIWTWSSVEVNLFDARFLHYDSNMLHCECKCSVLV